MVVSHPQFGADNRWDDQKLVAIKTGLDPNKDHVLRIIHSGKGNPYGKPAWVTIDGFVVQ